MSDSLNIRLRKLFLHPLQLSVERRIDEHSVVRPAYSYRDVFHLSLFESFAQDGYKYDVAKGTLIVDSRNPDNDRQKSDVPDAAKIVPAPPPSEDPHGIGTMRASPSHLDPDVSTFKQHSWGSFLTSFFGLPNRRDANGKITVKQIAKNFIGGWEWDPETSKSKKVLQVLGVIFGIKSILLPTLNLLIAVFKTASNIVGILTELLPSFIASASALAMSRLISSLADTDPHKGITGKKIGNWIGIISLGIPHFLFRAFTLVGRAFSSPQKSWDMAWRSGRYLGGDGIIGYILGSLFLGLSLATSIATWAVLLPITITLIPAAVTNFLAPALGPVIGALKPAFVAVANFLGPLFAPILGTMATSFGITISAGAAAIGVGLAAIATPVLTALSKIYKEGSNAWVSSWREGGFLKKTFSPVDALLSKFSRFLSSLRFQFSLTPANPASAAASEGATAATPTGGEDSFSLLGGPHDHSRLSDVEAQTDSFSAPLRPNPPTKHASTAPVAIPAAAPRSERLDFMRSRIGTQKPVAVRSNSADPSWTRENLSSSAFTLMPSTNHRRKVSDPTAETSPEKHKGPGLGGE